MRRQQRGRSLPGAVGALCRALPARSRPNPDTLRCAKFDRPQASLDFWRLLYALLKQIHGRKWAESDAIDNQIRFVKAALWYHGYYRPELYRLPSDGSVGSRELLLAFSWLLHRISLLEQLLARNRVKTGDETSVCTCEDDLSNSLKGTTEEAPEPGLEGGVDVRYLQWLNGRLRFQWRSLHAQHQEQCRLLHKIHLFTSGSHMDQILGHFSVTETDLVRQPENYKQLLQLLESETMQLEAFLEWKQLEPVYWQWMVKTREEELEKEGFSATARKIQESVELKLLDLAYLCAPPKKRMHGSHRLVFRSKHPASKMVFGRSVSKESVSTVSATEVIRELQIREASLARELKQLQEESRQRLDEVAEGLDGVICISP
ncbi:tubulin epsilon and delta complex protein 1 isoform X3 [Melopsittacus undulatus]|uniref:tubulin epsilon and delta complex protein 1 isoform X3 n=1 Tax=Melopsittacus undulatus TaxID=13146 RepID=UPI00146F42E1|nr:tubulin epsilon and delta complex protein 1 isoform X3 [Melopsittacus undulatus]